MDRKMTVLLLDDNGAELADADLLALRHPRNSKVVRQTSSDYYLAHLRLRVAEDPSLAELIEVLWTDKTGGQHTIGLTFEDEKRWPADFGMRLWETEIKISALHEKKNANAS